jgi:hypothetical protein
MSKDITQVVNEIFLEWMTQKNSNSICDGNNFLSSFT